MFKNSRISEHKVTMHSTLVTYKANGPAGSADGSTLPMAMAKAPSLNRGSELELLNLTLPADPKFVGFARRAVSGVLQQLNFDKASVDDIVLAVGEACNNAVAYPGESVGSSIFVICRLLPLPGATAAQRASTKTGTLQIDIRNHGDGFTRSIDDSRYEMPAAELMGEHGRGLPLMMAFLDNVQVLSEAGDTIVRLEKALPAEA